MNAAVAPTIPAASNPLRLRENFLSRMSLTRFDRMVNGSFVHLLLVPFV
jgi:hypothetical protein